MIGIMADSHGQPETIVAALDMLNAMGSQSIYHLGDVCDSAHPETAEACLGPLQEYNVITLKGNNEQAIVANHLDRETAPVSPKVLRYLQRLPLVRYYLNGVFTHSLPYARDLGLSCMIGAMEPSQALRFFNEFPHHILFRGHSHSPEVIWSQNGVTEIRSLNSGEKFDLTARLPCVVTCGALTRGFCMVWRSTENTIECLSFK